MRTRITKRDYELALQEKLELAASICTSCLVYQAAKRKGLKVAWVGYSEIELSGSVYKLAKSARRVSRAFRESWPSFIGKTITLPDVK